MIFDRKGITNTLFSNTYFMSVVDIIYISSISLTPFFSFFIKRNNSNRLDQRSHFFLLYSSSYLRLAWHSIISPQSACSATVARSTSNSLQPSPIQSNSVHNEAFAQFYQK
jgi:hypothetical protein